MNISAIKEKIAELAPRVAAFQARGRKPRDLTPAERRLALTDAPAFDTLAKAIQDETIALMRDEAAYQTLQEDLSAAEASERARQMEVARAERAELLALRGEASQQVDAALADADAAVVNLMDLSSKIAALDRACGEPDAHRASYGILALGLRRTIQDKSPTVSKLIGHQLPNQAKGRGLADMLTPAGYDFAQRGAADPFE